MDDRIPPEASPPPARPHSKRKPPEARKSELIRQAIDYFAEQGFDGGMRELARRIGITQPLFYRYFPSKDDLINEVYRALYLQQWKDSWVDVIRDRSRPLAERLAIFYADYTGTIFNRIWMRIFFFAGLKGLDINTRYIERVVSHLLVPICEEARAERGLDDAGPIARAEIELAWTMHGAIFYPGVREHIYGLDDPINQSQTIRISIDMYLRNLPATLAALTPPPG